MKVKKESGQMLFLVLLLKTVICSSNAVVPTSAKLADVLKDRGDRDVSFHSNELPKKVWKDPFFPKDISRLTASVEDPINTVNGNQPKACGLSGEVLAQTSKLPGYDWRVDDNTIALLHHDLQSLIECTRPQDRLLFINKQTIKLVRPLEIVHNLEFIGKPFSTSDSSLSNEMLPSLTCPPSKPALLVRSTKFKATALNITGCSSSSESSGAAIVLQLNANVTLNRLILKDNKNGAIYVNQTAHLVLAKSHLVHNSVSGNGGAIFLGKGNAVRIQGCVFTDNAASRKGGTMYVDANNTCDVEKSTFKDSTAGYWGGAIFLSERNAIRIQGSAFTHNAASLLGGTMYVQDNNVVDVEESTFTNNISEIGGGAIRLDDNNELTINGSSFTNNTSEQYSGGALALGSRNALIIEESSFTNNTSKSGNGGAIHVYGYNAMNIKESMFADNTCGAHGGGMFLSSNNMLIVQGSTFSDNLAKKDGGSICFGKNNRMTAYDSSMIDNDAVTNGGALLLSVSNHATLIRCTLTGNKAKNGSVSSLESDNSVTFERSTFSENICKSYGSVFYLGTNNFVLGSNSEITNNQAGQAGGQYNGAVYYAYSSNDVAFINSTISGNKNTKNGASYRHYSKKETSASSRKGIMV